ncbi:cytochrome P450 [Streptomyces sp. NPDC048349]|uniref:cytochrome P450 n=1 Tax=Streptomyces sp. NPDC048349 TaxID=3155486 RepID=UPI00342E57F2
MLLRGPRALQARFDRHNEVLGDWFPGLGRIVWLRDPQLIEQVVRSPGTDFAELGRLLQPSLGPSLASVEGAEHREIRQVVARSVRGEALTGCRAAIAASAQRLADSCPVNAPFRLTPLLERALLRANLEVTVGGAGVRDVDRWTDTFIRLRRTTDSFPAVLHCIGVLPWFPPLRRIREDCRALVRAEVVRRRRLAVASPDLLGRLLSADSTYLPDARVCDNILAFLFGGQGAVAAAAWTIERLVRHPAAWERVAAEAATGSGAYTDAVIYESLRVRPATGRVAWRLREPCEINGYRIPARTWVLVSIWDLHHDRRHYPQPGQFQPERFLGKRPPRQAWLPFGAGPHACPAGQLALLQIKEVVHALARRGRLAPAGPRDEQISWRSGVELFPSRGCSVILRG